jgi:RNA polymerase sigma-70 factor (sigma-E family)
VTGAELHRGEVEFEQFVRERYEQLLRYAVMLTGRQADAEEVVQEALVRCLRRWRRIEPENAMAYARKAVLNEFLRAVRKRPDVVYDEAGVVEDFAAATVNRDHLLAALRTLPARQRAAVVLRFLYDLPEAQVAQELGCSVGNVKSQTSRGLAKIRELWSNGHEVARRQA